MTKNNFLLDLNCCLQAPLTLTNLRAVLTLLVRSHYSSPKNFGLFENELACLAIDPDAQTNTLTVGLDFVPNINNPSPRPAIWINFMGATFDKNVIDNFVKYSEDNSGSTYARLQKVSYDIVHTHDSVDIALMMAETTADFFMGMRPHLMNTLGLSFLEVSKISKPTQPERSPDKHYEVGISLDIVYNHVVSTNIESHRLKKFAIELALINDPSQLS